ncbi:MAG: DUF3883 domain-containing protein [Anaerovoracaceae bacterium]
MIAQTGKFNQALKDYFDAECGAYTAITDEEIRKQTFNVKAVIRDLLIEKVGRSNIPAHGSNASTMGFMLSDDLSKRFASPRNISCKFSKPGKDEMTIYFSSESFIQKSSLSLGDYWCIYFKDGSSQPWFGYINLFVMDYIQQSHIGDIDIEPDEVNILAKDSTKTIKSLTYTIRVDDLTIANTEPPSLENFLSKPRAMRAGTTFTTSTVNMRRIMENKKIKGNRGEEIVVRIEKEKLNACGRRDLADKVEWRSRMIDGLGYDIESWETDKDGKNEKQIFIEVKSTSAGELEPFFISTNEVSVSKTKGDDYYIYRVYNLKPNSKTVGYFRISGNVENNFELIPQTYIAFAK